MILTIQREGTKDTELTINLLKVQNKFEMKSGLKLSSLYLLSKRRVRLKKTELNFVSITFSVSCYTLSLLRLSL